MQVSRRGSFVAGLLVALMVGGGTAVASGGVSISLGSANATRTTTGIADSTGTPLSLIAKKGSPPLRVSNTVKVKNLDSDLLDGKSASAFLAAGGTAVNAGNSALLGGQPASAFLPAGGTAADSDKLGGQPASSYTSTVYSAATTTDQAAVPLVPPTQIDSMTLPPGTWSLSITAYLENDDTKIGQFGCLALDGVSPNQVPFGGTSVDVMAPNMVQTKTYATLATSTMISITKATPFALLCVTIAPSAADGSLLSSDLTATRVTDPHGSVTVLN